MTHNNINQQRLHTIQTLKKMLDVAIQRKKFSDIRRIDKRITACLISLQDKSISGEVRKEIKALEISHKKAFSCVNQQMSELSVKLEEEIKKKPQIKAYSQSYNPSSRKVMA